MKLIKAYSQRETVELYTEQSIIVQGQPIQKLALSSCQEGSVQTTKIIGQ